MTQHVRVFELARDLGVGIPIIIEVAERLNLSVRHGVAELTPRQEQLIRAEVERGGWKDRKRREESDHSPYDPRFVRRYATCECCEILFSYVGFEKPSWCDTCADHYAVEGESTDRTLARLRNHEQRLRARLSYVSAKATEYETKMKSAFVSRQKWRAALVEIAVGHEPTGGGRCICGANEFPCATIRLLEYHNKGISREVERFTTLSREELDRQLYRDEPWKVNLIVEGDPPTQAEDGKPAA